MTIICCLLWDFPNLEGLVPEFISPMSRLAQLFPRTLGSIFVASYDSQGYSGGILTHLHMGLYCLGLRLLVSWSVYLGVRFSFVAHDQIFLIISRSEDVLTVKVGCPLWQEDGSIICIAVSLWSRSLRSHKYTLLSYSRLAQLCPWALGSRFVASYNSQGLWWRYYHLPPHSETTSVEVILQPMVIQTVHLILR
jgi:hypothetical protein